MSSDIINTIFGALTAHASLVAGITPVTMATAVRTEANNFVVSIDVPCLLFQFLVLTGRSSVFAIAVSENVCRQGLQATVLVLKRLQPPKFLNAHPRKLLLPSI
jgi:hypothetical protein